MELVTGKIYIIKSMQTNNIYIGSTIRNLKTRLIEHKSKYKTSNNKEHYSSFEILKYDDCYIELIKEVSCTLKQLLILEGIEIEKNENCVNKKIEGHVKRYEDKNDYEKYYRQTEQRKAYIKQININNYKCDCGGTYKISGKHRHDHTIRHKKYILEKI